MASPAYMVFAHFAMRLATTTYIAQISSTTFTSSSTTVGSTGIPSSSDLASTGLFSNSTMARGGTTVAQGVFIEMFLTAQLVFTIFMLAAEKHKGM